MAKWFLSVLLNQAHSGFIILQFHSFHRWLISTVCASVAPDSFVSVWAAYLALWFYSGQAGLWREQLWGPVQPWFNKHGDRLGLMLHVAWRQFSSLESKSLSYALFAPSLKHMCVNGILPCIKTTHRATCSQTTAATGYEQYFHQLQ